MALVAIFTLRDVQGKRLASQNRTSIPQLCAVYIDWSPIIFETKVVLMKSRMANA
jgi:hypothetical protein